MAESTDREYIKNMEREYIARYGRRDRKAGCLVNLTDGGEGPEGRIYKMAEETKKKLSDIRSIPIYCYSSEGKFIRSYKGIEEAAITLKIHRNNISTAFKHSGYAKGYYFFREYRGENLGYSYNPNRPHPNAKPVYCYKNGVYIATYESTVAAGKSLGIKREIVKDSIHQGKRYGEFNFYHQKQN